MARNLKDNAKKDMEAPLLPVKSYPARLVGVVFMGTQKQRPYNGETKPPHEEARYTYELSHEFMHDKEGNPIEDKPRWFSEDMLVYPPTAERATITKRNKAIDPNDSADGCPRSMLGLPCNVLIVQNPGKGKHAGKTFLNVEDVSGATDIPNYIQPDLVNPTFYFDPFDEDCTVEEFRALPEFVQNKIREADDYASSHIASLLEGGDDSSDDDLAEEGVDNNDEENNPY